MTKSADLQSTDSEKDAAERPTPVEDTTFEHSVDAREQEREQLADDVASFLEQGGRIEEVPLNFRADPPQKPQNNYGRGSI